MYSRRTGPSARASVALPGKGRRARPLELDVAAHAVAIDNLAEKNGTSVTELRYESPELVAGISHGERLASLGHPVAREDLHTLRCGKLPRIEPKMPRELLVQPNETRRSDGSGAKPREEPIRQARIAVVECKEIDCFGLCRHDSSSAQHLVSVPTPGVKSGALTGGFPVEYACGAEVAIGIGGYGGVAELHLNPGGPR